MQTLPAHVNPFALMLDPQAVLAVLAKIECSERLERLQRRICRPLDKPLLGMAGDDSAESADAGSDDDSAGDQALDDGARVIAGQTD